MSAYEKRIETIVTTISCHNISLQRDLNSRPSAYKADALPLSYAGTYIGVRIFWFKKLMFIQETWFLRFYTVLKLFLEEVILRGAFLFRLVPLRHVLLPFFLGFHYNNLLRIRGRG